jgi:hypothetical protein
MDAIHLGDGRNHVRTFGFALGHWLEILGLEILRTLRISPAGSDGRYTAQFTTKTPQPRISADSDRESQIHVHPRKSVAEAIT